MTADNAEGAPAASRMTRYVRWHGLGYCAVLLVLTIAYFLVPGDWNLFWPMLIWTVALIVHHLIVKSLVTDQDWVSERSSTILHNATDLSHIKSIRERHESRVSRSRPDTDAENSEVAASDETR